MNRREFITLLGGTAVAWPLAARAQQLQRVQRIGILMGVADDAETKGWLVTFNQRFEQLGWQAGRNLQIDERWTGGEPGASPANFWRRTRTRFSPSAQLPSRPCSARAAQCRSCSPPYPIRSEAASRKVSLVRAAMRQGSPISYRQWPPNGSKCSRRSHLRCSTRRCYSIPRPLPTFPNITGGRLRRRRLGSVYRRAWPFCTKWRISNRQWPYSPASRAAA